MTSAARHAALALAACLAIAWWLAPGIDSGTRMLARHYLFTQDLWVAVALLVALIVVARDVGKGGRFPAVLPRNVAITVAAALIVGGWIGARVVMARYDLSRDEQMATFDAAIFGGGRLFAPFPPTWRDFWDAVNQTFILPIGDREAWVSAYLPVNAALRAGFGVIDPTLAGPVYAAIGALALWRIAARLWPDARETQIVVLLLYVGSSQMWVTAMTAYAMNAHLALNLIWLWLFLGDRPWRHAAALAVGFLATGLHQPIFHPMYVLPFLDLLLREKRWRVLAAYVVGYGAIGLFWLGWPMWLAGQATTPPVAAVAVGFLDRLRQLSHGLNAEGLGLMAANLVRFATWQHLMLVPLLIAGVAATWARDAVARALVLGLLLPLAVVFVILPEQGLGWGYRYLHGVLGSACLLGGYGWRALGDAVPRRAMVATSVASVFVAMPWHAVLAHRFVAPFAAARAAVLSSGADIVLIDDGAAPFAQDLVVNRADLSNRPLLLKVSAVRPDQMASLCSRGSIGFLPPGPLARIAAQFGMVGGDRTAALRAAASAARCDVRQTG